jgi:inosose dehydratase
VGFVVQPLHDPSRRDEVLDVARRTLDLLGALGAGVLVTIDHVSEERMAVAGRPDLARPLDAGAFRAMVALVDEGADMALMRGVRPALHQRTGCYVETDDEVEAVLAAVEPERLGLCVDTGHMTYAGIDPIAMVRRHAGRLAHLHLKEVDPAVLAHVVAEGIPFLPATAMGVFCPLGRGGFDWPAFGRALAEAGYAGAATVEQDVDPGVGPNPLADARESLATLRVAGLVSPAGG